MMLQEFEFKTVKERAIASAANHGITLVEGRGNPGAGDCAFESVIFVQNFVQSQDWFSIFKASIKFVHNCVS